MFRTSPPSGCGFPPAPGRVRKVLEELAGEGCRHVYLDGGAVIREGLREGVIDSLALSVLPVVLGQGVRLFEDGLPRSGWRLDGTLQLPSGVVQLRYRNNQTGLVMSTVKPGL